MNKLFSDLFYFLSKFFANEQRTYEDELKGGLLKGFFFISLIIVFFGFSVYKFFELHVFYHRLILIILNLSASVSFFVIFQITLQNIKDLKKIKKLRQSRTLKNK